MAKYRTLFLFPFFRALDDVVETGVVDVGVSSKDTATAGDDVATGNSVSSATGESADTGVVGCEPASDFGVLCFRGRWRRLSSVLTALLQSESASWSPNKINST